MGPGHGLIFRSLDLQDGDDPSEAGIWLDLINPFEPAEVRGAGDDFVIPQKPGMTPMDKYKHRRVLELRGHVRGLGEDLDERAASFYSLSEDLRAVMDMDLDPGTLEWVSPYLGLPSGSQTIEARCIDATPGPILNRMSFQRWSFRLISVSNPPEWEPGS